MIDPDLSVPDDYCQGEREHYYTDDDDWLFEEEDKLIVRKTPIRITPRNQR